MVVVEKRVKKFRKKVPAAKKSANVERRIASLLSKSNRKEGPSTGIPRSPVQKPTSSSNRAVENEAQSGSDEGPVSAARVRMEQEKANKLKRKMSSASSVASTASKKKKQPAGFLSNFNPVKEQKSLEKHQRTEKAKKLRVQVAAGAQNLETVPSGKARKRPRVNEGDDDTYWQKDLRSLSKNADVDAELLDDDQPAGPQTAAEALGLKTMRQQMKSQNHLRTLEHQARHDYEYRLRQVATTGVVQFLNALQQAQAAGRQALVEKEKVTTLDKAQEHKVAATKDAFLSALQKTQPTRY